MADTEVLIVTVAEFRPILLAWLAAVTPGVTLSEELQERLWVAFMETVRTETTVAETPILTTLSA